MQYETLTTTEAADHLEVSEATVRRLIGDGHLRAEKRGGHWFVGSCDVEKLEEAFIQAEAEDLEEDDTEEEDDDIYDDDDLE